MNFPEQAAQTPQPSAAASKAPQRSSAPQSWMVRVRDARYHWYDLVAGFADAPELHDPIGRYLRRMQFELDALSHQRHLFLAVTRPRLRFDIGGVLQWGFSSLKLTLPLLRGAGQARDCVTVELKAPSTAPLKKPTVMLTEHFISLDWGSVVEVFSVHDLLRQYAPDAQPPGTVRYVGQTRDAGGRLGKGRLPALRQLRAELGPDDDMLILALGVEIDVRCADGDPAALPHNRQAAAADALQAERLDLIEAALIRHFEGGAPPLRPPQERAARAARLALAQAGNQLVQYTIDLAVPAAGGYGQLGSECAGAAPRHLLSCFIAEGQAQVAPMPLPAPGTGTKS